MEWQFAKAPNLTNHLVGPGLEGSGRLGNLSNKRVGGGGGGPPHPPPSSKTDRRNSGGMIRQHARNPD